MRRPFGTTPDGRAVEAVSLHAGDLSVTLLTLGAAIHDVRLKGVPYPLTLGATDIAAYAGPMTYFGALVGPVANRIAGASAPLNGDLLSFEANEGTTCLHGGPHGMHTEVWQIESATDNAVTMTLELPDGTGGFTGNRTVKARFSLDAPAHLRLVIEAETDKDTYINIANHSYWSLDGTPTISGHILTIPADRYTPVDRALIPTGVADVHGTDFDFRSGRAVGDGTPRIDHNLCLSDAPRDTLQHACTLTGQSGVTLRIDTTEPGLQAYDAGKQSSAPYVGLTGKPYGAFCGMALEPQRWPDGPNQTGFPTCRLNAGDVYRQETVWSFSKA